MSIVNEDQILSAGRCIACALALFTLALFGLSLPAAATVTITPTTDAAALAAVLASAASDDITVVTSPPPTLKVGNSTISSGTFTTRNSGIELNRGIVLSTGNVSYLPVGEGQPNSTGSGVSNPASNEFDVAEFSFTFTPKPNVKVVKFGFVFVSDEYNDNSRNTPNNDQFLYYYGLFPPKDIVSIQRYNKTNNPQIFRDNTVEPKPFPDLKVKGGTILLTFSQIVTPGVKYTLTLRISDVGNNAGDSAVFFGANPRVKLDLSNAIPGNDYTTTWRGGAPVPIAGPDVVITGSGETLNSATINNTFLAPGDLLSVIGPLPPGITASAYDPNTGNIILSGKASYAAYQTALAQIGYSSTATDPTGGTGDDKLMTVTIFDTNSSVAVAGSNIVIIKMDVSKTYSLPPESNGLARTNDLITYSYVVTNNGSAPMRDVSVRDWHGSPPVLVPLGGVGITSERLTTPGPKGAAASTDIAPNNGVWDVLAPGASVTFTWPHVVTLAEFDRG